MKQKRTRIAPNIYRYPDGRYEVIVSEAGRQAPPTRFPAETPLTAVAQWRDDARKRLAQEAKDLGEDLPKTHAGGTLRSEAQDFVAQLGKRAGTASDVSHLRAWFEVVVDGVPLGDLPLSAWKMSHVNKAVTIWESGPSPHAIRRVRVGGYTRAPRGEGLRSRGRTRSVRPVEAHERRAAATSGRVTAALNIRHRLRVLQNFFRTLARNAQTPEERESTEHPSTVVDGARWPKRGKSTPVTVPEEIVVATLERLARMGDGQTFGRFFVAASTGQRPCQIGFATPDDVNLEDEIPTWLVRDAKGEPAHSIELNAIQVTAWSAFIQADAWGVFDTSDYGKRVHAAGWPVGIKPYAARHSLAKAAIKRGAHLGDLQGLLGHSNPQTTRTFYAPFQVEEQSRISAQLGGGKRRRPVKPLGPYLGDVLKPRAVAGGKDRGKA